MMVSQDPSGQRFFHVADRQDAGADVVSGRRLRAFVTGATGFIGSAVVRALQERGHHVTGLARSPASANRLLAVGAQAVSGDLEQADSFLPAASAADVIVHTGFPRDAFSRMADAVRTEQQVTGRLADAASRTGALLIYTSGIGVVGETGSRTVTEDDPVSTPPGMTWRRDLEMQVLGTGPYPYWLYPTGSPDPSA